MKCRVIGSDGIPTQDAEILRMVDTDDGPAYEVYLRDSDMVDLVGDELIVFDNPSGYLAEEVIDGRRTPAKYEGRVSWMPYSYGISTVANELDDEPVPGYRADGPTPGKIEWIFPTGYFREGSLEPLAPNSGGLMLIESIPNRLVMKTAYRNEEAKIFADYPELRAEIVELEREFPAKVSEKRTDIRIPATVGADLIDRHNLGLLASQYGFRDAQELLRMLFEVAYYYRVSGVNLTSTGQKQTSAQVGIVTGNETSLFVPGKSLKELTAQWAVVSAPDLIASHVPNDRPGEGFTENASYPAQVQERDYQRDLNEADKVRRQARQFRAALVVNTNPDAVNGAPIVTRDMIVLGGNSRVMTMQLLYQQGKGQEIKRRLGLLCSQNCFGVTEQELDLVARPVLVRMLPETSKEMGQAKLREFVRALNVSLTQELDRQDATVALARVVPESERRALMMQFYQFLTDTSLPTFISRYNAFFSDFLFRSGLVTNQNVAANVVQTGERKGELTPAGEQMVESVLFGVVFEDDPRVVGKLKRRQYNATRDVLGILIATGAKEGYSLIPAFRVAMQAANEGKSAQNEGGLFAQPLDLPVLPKMILYVYEEFQTRPAQFRRIFLRYLEAIRSPMISPTSQAALFASVEQERLSPEWVFAWASGLTVDGGKVQRESSDFAALDRIRDGARVSNPSYRQVINTSKGRFTTQVEREGSRYTFEQDLGEFGARKGSLDYPRLYQASALLELAQKPENLRAARALIRRALLDVRDLSQTELDSLIDLLYAERAEIPVLIPEIDEEPPAPVFEPPAPVAERDFLDITERFEEIPEPVVQTSTPELPSTAEELLSLDVSEIEDRASARGMDDLLLTQALQIIDDPSEEPTFNILGKVFYVVTETVVEGKKQLSKKQRQYKAVAEYLKRLNLIKDYRVNVSGDTDRDWKVAVSLLVELFEAPVVEPVAPVVEPPAPVRAKKQKTVKATRFELETAKRLTTGGELSKSQIDAIRSFPRFWRYGSVLPSLENALVDFQSLGLIGYVEYPNPERGKKRGLQRFSTEPDYIEQQYLSAIGQFVKRYYAKDVAEEKRIQHSPDFYMDNYKISAGPERKLEAKLRKELGLPAGNPGLVFAEAFKKNLLPEVVFEGLPERFKEPSAPAPKAPAIEPPAPVVEPSVSPTVYDLESGDEDRALAAWRSLLRITYADSKIRYSILLEKLVKEVDFLPYNFDKIEAAAFRKWFKDNGVKNLKIKVRRYSMASGLSWNGQDLTDAEIQKIRFMTSIKDPKLEDGFLDNNRTGAGDIYIKMPFIRSFVRILIQKIMDYNRKKKGTKGFKEIPLTELSLIVSQLKFQPADPKKKGKTPPEVDQAPAPAPVPAAPSSSAYVIKAGGNSMDLFALPFYQLIPEAQRPAVFDAVDTWIRAVVKSQGAPKSKSATWAQIKPKREFNPAFYWDQQVRDDREAARIVLEEVLSPDFPLLWTELLNIAIVNFYAPEGLWPLPRRGLKYSKEEKSWIRMHTFEFAEIQSLWQTVYLELKTLTRDQLVTFEDFYCSDEGYNYGYWGRMNCRTTTLAKTTPTNVFRIIYKNDRDRFSYHETLEGWKTPQELRDSRHDLDSFTMRARDMLAYIRRAKNAKIGIDDKPATRAEAKEYLEAWGFERFLKSILKADDRTSDESIFMSRIRRQFEELPEDQKLDIMLQASNTNRIKPIRRKAGMWPANIFYEQLFERLSKEGASWQRIQKALEKLGSKLEKSAYKSYRLKPLGQDFQLVGLPDQTIEETVDYFAKEYKKNKFRKSKEIAKQDKIDVSGRFKTIQVLRLLRKNALDLLSDYIDANKRRERIKEQDNKKKLVDMLEDTDYSTLYHYWQYRDRLTDLKPQKEAIAKLDALIAEEDKKAQAQKEAAQEPAPRQREAQSKVLGPRAKKVLRSHRDIAQFLKKGLAEEYPKRWVSTEENREDAKKGQIKVDMYRNNQLDALVTVNTKGEFVFPYVSPSADLNEPISVTVERIMEGADVRIPRAVVTPADEQRAQTFTKQILPAGLVLKPYPYTKKNGEVLEGSSVIAIVERLPREDFRDLLQAAKKKRGFYIRGEQGFVIRSGNLDQFVADAVAILGDREDNPPSLNKTPALPHERIHGGKNRPGIASRPANVDVGATMERQLRKMQRKHNAENPDNKVTLKQLKSVCHRARGAYSTSHRPGVSRDGWCIARVKAFLYLVATGSPRNPAYTQDNDLIESNPAAVPPLYMQRAAQLSLALSERFPNRDGMTRTGKEQRRRIAAGVPLNEEQVKKLYSFLSRSAVWADSAGAESRGFFGDRSNPSRGYIAILGWGGDGGERARNWAARQLDKWEA